jgi:hypothetical protein
VGLNPDIVYWMDVGNASYYINIRKNNENKGSRMGHNSRKNITSTSSTASKSHPRKQVDLTALKATMSLSPGACVMNK